MRLLTAFLIFFLFLGLNFQSCQTDKPKDNGNQTIQDTLPPLNSRTSNVRGYTAQDVFLRVPDEAIHIEGWDKLSIKERKGLVSKGKLNQLEAKAEGNQIVLTEKFFNEDDEHEKAAQLTMTVFRHSEEDLNIVFISQLYKYEDPHICDEIIDQRLWQHDGKSWTDISKSLPKIETKMFFDEGFDLGNIKEDFIVLSPAQINENTLSATLLFDAYAKQGIKPQKMITNETFAINLIWNGQMFELQRKPSVLN